MTQLETKIVCHHVGGRGFGVSLNAPPQFWPDLVHVLYEADADNVREMADDQSHPQRQLLGGEFYITPYCLGDRVGKGTLNLTANAFASSLFRPDPKFFKYYCEVAVPPTTRDVTYHDMLEIVAEVELEITTLDHLFDHGKLPYPSSPDFLSIDTQGAELAIMRGASRTIANSVLGMVTEVEIKTMYTGQPLLGDILKYAEETGFHFAGFTYLQEVSTFRAPIGFRAKGFPGFGDALFLRKLADIGSMAASPVEHYLKLRKLAFIAINFGHVEYGLNALTEAEKISVRHGTALPTSDRNYDVFLDEALKCYRTAEPLYPSFIGIPDSARPAAPRKGHPALSADAPGDDGLLSFVAPAPSAKLPEPRKPMAAGALRALHANIVGRAQSDSRRIRELIFSDPRTAIAKLTLYGARGFSARLGMRGWLRARLMTHATEAVAPVTTVASSNAPRQGPLEPILLAYGFTGVSETVRARRVASEASARRQGSDSSEGSQFGPTVSP